MPEPNVETFITKEERNERFAALRLKGAKGLAKWSESVETMAEDDQLRRIGRTLWYVSYAN
jgi:hypothetical protein